MIHAWGSRLRALLWDTSGLALIEFSIVAPVMIAFFLGGYQLSDASACRRRVMIMARAATDLTSQYAVLSASQVDTILNASTQIMVPYDATNATIRVTQITVDADGKHAKVTWSRVLSPKNGDTAYAKDLDVTSTLPKTLRVANQSVIYGEVTYNYTPAIGNVIPSLSFTDTLFMLPRVSAAVTCDDC